jgi:hypothetical protein
MNTLLIFGSIFMRKLTYIAKPARGRYGDCVYLTVEGEPDFFRVSRYKLRNRRNWEEKTYIYHSDGTFEYMIGESVRRYYKPERVPVLFTPLYEWLRVSYEYFAKFSPWWSARVERIVGVDELPA